MCGHHTIRNFPVAKAVRRVRHQPVYQDSEEILPLDDCAFLSAPAGTSPQSKIPAYPVPPLKASPGWMYFSLYPICSKDNNRRNSWILSVLRFESDRNFWISARTFYGTNPLQNCSSPFFHAIHSRPVLLIRIRFRRLKQPAAAPRNSPSFRKPSSFRPRNCYWPFPRWRIFHAMPDRKEE